MTTNAAELARNIGELDDAAAVRLLDAVIKPRELAGECTLEWTPDLGSALRDEFDVPDATAAAPQAEVARQTLALLACDERYAGPIESLINHASSGQMRSFALDPVSATVLMSAALFALQSHIEITRDKEGRWTFKFIKKPTDSAMITPLIKKLVGLISGGS